MMLHTKYQGSMPSMFRQEDVLCFPYLDLKRDPGWNKLGKGPLDNATQNTKALSSIFGHRVII